MRRGRRPSRGSRPGAPHRSPSDQTVVTPGASPVRPNVRFGTPASVRRMSDTDDRPGAPLAADPALARNPQPTYRSLVESTPAFRMDAVGVVAASRAAADGVLRHPDIFSSTISSIDLKTSLPQIPMS